MNDRRACCMHTDEKPVCLVADDVVYLCCERLDLLDILNEKELN